MTVQTNDRSDLREIIYTSLLVESVMALTCFPAPSAMGLADKHRYIKLDVVVVVVPSLELDLDLKRVESAHQTALEARSERDVVFVDRS